MSKVAPAEDTGTSVLHKHPKTREFVQVENSTARDPRLSFKATGLLVHLLSLPQGSKLGSVELAKVRPKQGRVAIQAAYKELREFGYVTQERVQSEGGQWKTVTHVYEVPPDAGNLPSAPDAGSPKSANLPVSLRDKDQEIKDGRKAFKCPSPVCDRTFPTYDEAQDHYADCVDPVFVPADALPVTGGRPNV